MNRRRKSRNTGLEISIDSLIDIFMNVLGILIFYAMIIALYGGTPKLESESSIEKPEVKSQTVHLAQEREVSTDPVFVHASLTGIRLVDLDNSSLTYRYYQRQSSGSSLKLTPITSSSASKQEITAFLEKLTPSKNHVVILLHPKRVQDYSWIRKQASERGLESGWEDYERSELTFGSSGQTMNSVQ
jgi:hypothetical protein